MSYRNARSLFYKEINSDFCISLYTHPVYIDLKYNNIKVLQNVKYFNSLEVENAFCMTQNHEIKR